MNLMNGDDSKSRSQMMLEIPLLRATASQPATRDMDMLPSEIGGTVVFPSRTKFEMLLVNFVGRMSHSVGSFPCLLAIYFV